HTTAHVMPVTRTKDVPRLERPKGALVGANGFMGASSVNKRCFPATDARPFPVWRAVCKGQGRLSRSPQNKVLLAPHPKSHRCLHPVAPGAGRPGAFPEADRRTRLPEKSGAPRRSVVRKQQPVVRRLRQPQRLTSCPVLISRHLAPHHTVAGPIGLTRRCLREASSTNVSGHTDRLSFTFSKVSVVRD